MYMLMYVLMYVLNHLHTDTRMLIWRSFGAHDRVQARVAAEAALVATVSDEDAAQAALETALAPLEAAGPKATEGSGSRAPLLAG